MSSIEVVGLGAMNMDQIYQVERILSDGEAVVDMAAAFPGGSAANTIYGLARLGVATGFVGAIGDDAKGKMMLHDFEGVGVDTSQIKVKPGTETGSVVCLSDRRGRRSLYVIPGVNDELSADDLDSDYINQARILHLSSFAGDKQLDMLLELMGRLAAKVSLSFAPGALYAAKGAQTLTPILSRTHLLFINQDEVRQLTGQDIVPGAETCLRQGCRTVVITLGGGMMLKLDRRGNVDAVCYIRDAEHEYAVESRDRSPSQEVDTTGAGDAFAAGFLYGVLNNRGLVECGRLGDIAARFAISRLGTRGGFPSLNRLQQRYRSLYHED